MSVHKREVGECTQDDDETNMCSLADEIWTDEGNSLFICTIPYDIGCPNRHEENKVDSRGV